MKYRRKRQLFEGLAKNNGFKDGDRIEFAEDYMGFKKGKIVTLKLYEPSKNLVTPDYWNLLNAKYYRADEPKTGFGAFLEKHNL